MVHYFPPVGLSTLFRPLPKIKEKNRATLNVTYKSANGQHEFNFSARQALGIPEQTLLLVLFELAQEQYAVFSSDVVLSSTTSNQLGQELWIKLHKGLYNALGKTLSFTTSWFELSCRCGLVDGGANHKLRQKQLERLCEVVVWETQKVSSGKEIKRQSYLVSWLLGDDGKIHLALNCRLASALLGEHYAQVSMAERLSLMREPARAVHAFLSTTVSRGKSLKIGVDTLMQRLWPEGGLVVPAGTLRRRQKDVRDALNAIAALAGWQVSWERTDMAYIRRSKMGAHGEMRRTIANKDMSYREQECSEKVNKINELRSFDVSGLFFNKANSA
jgi:hypothetical protein